LLAVAIPGSPLIYQYDDSQSREAEEIRELEKEYGLTFEGTSIGTGAAAPGFVTVIEWVGLIVPILLAGKPLKDNFEVYKSWYEWVKRLFHREPSLNRNAALVVALREIANKIEKSEHTYRLVAYKRMNLKAEEPEPETMSGIQDAEERIEALNAHLFEFEVDGKRIKVSIHGTDVRMRMEGETQPLLPTLAELFRDSEEK
jgi:hypothetical protein